MRVASIAVALGLLLVAGLHAQAGSELEVAAAVGVLEPEGIEAGQRLQAGTPVRLEPWGRLVMRELAGCELTLVVAGTPEHEVGPPRDCADTAEPAAVLAALQQGAAFAAYLPASELTGQLVEAMAQEPCVFMPRVSEEGENRRVCPSGYALRALRCTGDYCDNKDLLCCPYLDGEPDATATKMGSRVISEEPPNNSVQSKKGFLCGLTCYGPFCDEMEPYQFRSDRLSNDRKCDWSDWSSNRPGEWLDCGDRLISGIRCRDDYCGTVAVMCCGAEVE